MEKNVFTTKLLNTILLSPSQSSLIGASGIFLVLSYVEYDLGHLLHNESSVQFSEEHAVVLLYNLLCAINFLHSVNLMHRDIKPSNVLVNSKCNVTLCDFGLARSCSTITMSKANTAFSDNSFLVSHQNQ